MYKVLCHVKQGAGRGKHNNILINVRWPKISGDLEISLIGVHSIPLALSIFYPAVKKASSLLNGVEKLLAPSPLGHVLILYLLHPTEKILLEIHRTYAKWE